MAAWTAKMTAEAEHSAWHGVAWGSLIALILTSNRLLRFIEGIIMSLRAPMQFTAPQL